MLYRIINFPILLSLLAIFPCLTCTRDNFLDTMKVEEGTKEPYTVYENEFERSVYYRISDSGQIQSRVSKDDGDFQDTPYPIDLVVMNNVIGNDDIVVDHNSTLVWTKCTALDNGAMDTDDNCLGGTHGLYNWNEAINLCSTLTYGGYDDWRMPTITELFSLVNFEYIAPAIDSAIFPNTEGTVGTMGKYWAATTYNDTEYVFKWHIDFNSVDLGSLFFVNISYSTDEMFLRCVRGPSSYVSAREDQKRK